MAYSGKDVCKSGSVDDKEIISMFWNRDESAIKNLQKEYGNELMRLSLRILGNMEFYRH